MSVPVHFILIVWGERFTEFFLTYALSTLLTPGNFAIEGVWGDSIFKIITTRADAGRIDRYPAIAELRRYIPVVFEVVDEAGEKELQNQDVYRVLGFLNQHAVAAAAAAGAYVSFLGPDALTGEGAMMRLKEWIEAGYETVMISGVRAVLEDVTPLLAAMPRRPDGGIVVDNRTLVDFLIDFPHPMTQALFSNAQGFNNGSPSHIYVWTGEREFTAHCWHLHPLLTKPVDGQVNFSGPMDDYYVEIAVRNPLTTKIVQSSDDLCMIEVSRRNHWADALINLRPMDTQKVIAWAVSCLYPVHRRFFETPVVFRGGPGRSACDAPGDPAGLLRLIQPALPPNLIRIDDLRAYAGVWLLGSGLAGRTLAQAFCEAGLRVLGFANGLITEPDECLGLPVIPLDQFRLASGEALVIASEARGKLALRCAELELAPVFDAYPIYRRLIEGDYVNPLSLVAWPG